jgi:hypothetical protein
MMNRRSRIALVLAGALASGPMPALEVNGQTIRYTEREVAMLRSICQGGGCTIFHLDGLTARIAELMDEAHEDGRKAAIASGCKGKGPNT